MNVLAGTSEYGVLHSGRLNIAVSACKYDAVQR